MSIYFKELPPLSTLLNALFIVDELFGLSLFRVNFEPIF